MERHEVSETDHSQAKHGEHEGHGGHGVDHTGHELMFRNRFWVSLVLTIPVLLFSPMIQEWFGYNLVYDLSHQRFLIFEGEGANGKSVVCHVLRNLVGEDNVTAVPLEIFGQRFQL